MGGQGGEGVGVCVHVEQCSGGEEVEAEKALVRGDGAGGWEGRAGGGVVLCGDETAGDVGV